MKSLTDKHEKILSIVNHRRDCNSFLYQFLTTDTVAIEHKINSYVTLLLFRNFQVSTCIFVIFRQKLKKKTIITLKGTVAS